MEVRKDFAKRVTALSQGVPRNVVAQLLKRLLPPEPVSVRRPEGGWKLDPPAGTTPAPMSTGGFLAKVKTRKPRRGPIVHCQYKVLNRYAVVNHRWGTWTHAMVDSVVEADALHDEDYTTAAQAQEYLSKHYPKYADRKIDWNWLAKDVGYIELK